MKCEELTVGYEAYDTKICPNTADAIQIFQFQKRFYRPPIIKYRCRQCISNYRFPTWIINTMGRSGDKRITIATLPLKEMPIPMDFWDANNIQPQDFPYFADIYRETYGSIPKKSLVDSPHQSTL